MKLLLDNNLSPRLVNQLAALFPDSSRVALLDLDRASDQQVWEIARQSGYCLVSKDADFNELVTRNGFPPKVIWIRIGNCTTAEIARLLRENHDSLLDFAASEDAGILELA
jgi:predicted nuclease of predicted toxin-antitoxin system